MATVLVPSPQAPIAMSNRRVPLANVPNVANSPRRGGLLATKRQRPTNSHIEGSLSQPPLKKQILQRNNGEAKVMVRKVASQTAESKIFTRRNTAQPSAFEQRLEAAREKNAAPKKLLSPERVRAWQEHYLKAIPEFVFYFDVTREDLCEIYSEEILFFGAKHERFFSRDVTHVVTNRPIPSESEHQAQENTSTASSKVSRLGGNATVSQENRAAQPGHARLRHGLDRKTGSTDLKREVNPNADILSRAKHMNMKIWSIDKLHRFLVALHEHPTQRGHNRNIFKLANKEEPDLSTVLQNERLNGPSNVDSMANKDVVPFKGPYIFIYDFYDEYRPSMAREYPKVAKKSEGAWPRLRSTTAGKCPFVEDPDYEKETEGSAAAEKKKHSAATGKPVLAPQLKAMAPPPPFEKPAPKMVQADRRKPEASTRSQTGLHRSGVANFAAPAASFGSLSRGEIVASGIQPSNITSAIRSQMISSTAPIPGVKTATSKEIHELKRKVFGDILSQKPSNSAARVPPARASKVKALENLGTIPEDKRLQAAKTQKGTKTKHRSKRDPKPGYCENCREKFEDFEEHVITRQHRKFAANDSNWADLDKLLEKLRR